MSSASNGNELKSAYDELHKKSDLRFPIQDYGKFLELLDVKSGEILTDIACGKGFLLAEAEKAGLKACGVDFSDVGLRMARARLKTPCLVSGDAERLPFRDASHDCIANLGSLEHFLDPAKAVREMARVIKKGGRVLIVVPNLYSLATIWKVYRYGFGEKQEEQELHSFTTINDWKGLIEGNGLEIRKVIKYNGFHHIDWYFRRKDPKVAPLWERLCRSVMNYTLKPAIPLNLSAYFIFICTVKAE